MKTQKIVKTLLSVILIACVCLAAGCGSGKESKEPANIFVAASLKKPMDAVIEKYTAETGRQVNANYASSGNLFAQIKENQPCDLYFPADWLYAEKMQDEKLENFSEPFLTDNIVLSVADSAKDKVKTFEDLAKEDVTVAICDPAAPAGVYAENGLKSLGIWDSMQGNIKTRPSTINQAAMMVKENEVDATLLYSSVANSNGLEIVAVMDKKDSGDIVYAICGVKGGDEEFAKDFAEFVQKDENLAEFEAYGWIGADK